MTSISSTILRQICPWARSHPVVSFGLGDRWNPRFGGMCADLPDVFHVSYRLNLLHKAALGRCACWSHEPPEESTSSLALQLPAPDTEELQMTFRVMGVAQMRCLLLGLVLPSPSGRLHFERSAYTSTCLLPSRSYIRTKGSTRQAV
jgi:hypothetical protein